MAEITETLVTQKLEDGWSRKTKLDNFLEEKELSVTITLEEYRRLVSSDATADSRIKSAEDKKYEREKEIETLKKKVQELETFIDSFMKRCNKDDSQPVEDDEWGDK